MKTLTYSVEVKNSIKSLWDCFVDPEKYKQWVKAFSENSTMKWKWWIWEIVYFLDPDMGWTKVNIKQFKDFEIIEAEHIATVTKDWIEEITWNMTEKWIWTQERYIFEETENGAKLTLKIYTHEEFIPMYESACPMAMKYIKEITQK